MKMSHEVAPPVKGKCQVHPITGYEGPEGGGGGRDTALLFL